MKLSSVGEVERHRVDFSFNQFRGDVSSVFSPASGAVILERSGF
ncbi:hypothetical protein [Nonomuraea mesophila]|nr:hypothetical protein [Nonomuraea mesophila]